MKAKQLSLLAPIIIGALGVGWIQCAIWHFERVTKREAYALAGYHYSVPEWGFQYHPGGQIIHRWTTIVPPYVTLAALVVCFAVTLALNRHAGWKWLTGIVAIHGLVGAVFVLVAGLYDLTVTGIFI